MQILIADDHPLFRDALREILKRAHPGAQLMEVGDVGALFGVAEANPDADLLLLDLNMPGAHGFSALIHLRGLYPTLPIIVVSARSEALTMRRAIAHGAMGFIPKSADATSIGSDIFGNAPANIPPKLPISVSVRSLNVERAYSRIFATARFALSIETPASAYEIELVILVPSRLARIFLI